MESFVPKPPTVLEVPKPPTVLTRKGTAVGLFLRSTETPKHPAIPCFMLVANGRMEHAKVQQRVLESLCKYERFTSVLQGDTWVHVHGAFDIRDHVKVLSKSDLDGDWPPTAERCRRLIERKFNVPFDKGKPMWEMYVAHGYAEDGGTDGKDGPQTAVIARVHHVIVDGTAAGLMLGQLSDEAKADALIDASTKAKIAAKVKELSARVSQGCGPVYMACGAAAVLCKYVGNALRAEPPSPFRGLTTGQRTLAWRGSIDLEGSLGAARRLGCTLNDLWMACLAYAMGEYMRRNRGRTGEAATDAEADASTDGLELTAGIPVSLHSPILPPEVGNSSGNKFGFLLVRLPMGRRPPNDQGSRARLHQVQAVLKMAKHSPEALVSYQLASLASCLPREWVSDAVTAGGNSSSSVIMSNVRGPPKQLHINGSAIQSLIGFLPTPPGVALGIGLGTYAGKLGLSVTCDRCMGENSAETLLGLMLEEHTRFLREVSPFTGTEVPAAPKASHPPGPPAVTPEPGSGKARPNGPTEAPSPSDPPAAPKTPPPAPAEATAVRAGGQQTTPGDQPNAEPSALPSAPRPGTRPAPALTA